MPRTARDWRAESHECLLAARPSWLSSYDISRKIRGRSGENHGSGRDAARIREECENLAAAGLVDRREVPQEGAPYGKPYVYFRAREENGDGMQ